MNKKVMMFIKILLLIAIFAVLFIAIKKFKPQSNTPDNPTELEKANNIQVVPTMRDKIASDASWCGTFQLVWNDMKNEVVKMDIIFNPQEEMATNLNMEEFTENMISDEYYFKKYGIKTLELKKEIEDGIKAKFDQTSDILEDFDWSESAINDPDRYFFYVMLYRKFEFLKEFDKLDDGKFGKDYDNIKYFGINKNTKKEVRDQIDVLYYNSQEDFAIVLNTKTGDEVIFCKGPKGEDFKSIYDNMIDESINYTSNTYFTNVDEFKAPNLTFNEKREYTEFEGKIFGTADPLYPIAEIIKAVQSIKFSLDEKGGEIKSEAGIDMQKTSSALPSKPEEPRYFFVDDTFAIFLREKGQELPYFAGRIETITNFQ